MCFRSVDFMNAPFWHVLLAIDHNLVVVKCIHSWRVFHYSQLPVFDDTIMRLLSTFTVCYYSPLFLARIKDLLRTINTFDSSILNSSLQFKPPS
jgi:hypothetical protein